MMDYEAVDRREWELGQIDSIATSYELQIIGSILKELRRAEKIHPDWPDDTIHRVAIVNEEAGELVKAVLDESEGKIDPMHSSYDEAVQTAAMCVRFIKNM